MIKICSDVTPFPEVVSDYVVEKNYSIQILSSKLTSSTRFCSSSDCFASAFSSACCFYSLHYLQDFICLFVLQHPQKSMQMLPKSLPVYRILSSSLQLPIVEYVFPSRTIFQLALYSDYIYSRSLAWFFFVQYVNSESLCLILHSLRLRTKFSLEVNPFPTSCRCIRFSLPGPWHSRLIN